MLIDRSGDGQEVDTGAKPVFSPGGGRFATVQQSDAGWGGFEGFAVYAVHPRGFSPEYLEFGLPELEDWRIDRWVGENCIILSAVPRERLEGDYDRLPTAKRDEYISKAEDRWKLAPGSKC